ncbi:MAG TPA: zinc-binding dehydrogenase [Acidimicrobiales bacterium]
MFAIRLHAFGPAENLVYEEVDDPTPGPGQVRVRVRAAGVHLLDTTIRRGESGGPFPLPDLPQIPGREVAGDVDAVGEGVDAGWVGKRVVAHLGMASQGYAELVVAPVGSLHELPDGLGYDAAVAMIGTGRTTLAVLEAAELRPDDVVLVTAAAGGIGNLLVQAARNVGATVTGVAGGPDKVARVRELGADIALDYRNPTWADDLRAELGDRQLTVAFDSVGGPVGRAALELLAPGGRLVIYGWSSGTPTALSADDIVGRSLTVTGAIGPKLTQRPGGLRDFETEALARAASGEWVPLVDSRFPLADAAKAHRALEERGTVGKVILVP